MTLNSPNDTASCGELPQEGDLEVVVAQQHEVANRHNLGSGDCRNPPDSES